MIIWGLKVVTTLNCVIVTENVVRFPSVGSYSARFKRDSVRHHRHIWMYINAFEIR